MTEERATKKRKAPPREPVAPLPQGKKYQLILADPPWPYRGSMSGFRPLPYPTLTLKQLREMPVSEIAADDSVLLMWTTGGFMDASIQLMKSWGFEYKAMFIVWTKVQALEGEKAYKAQTNTGYYSLPNCEFLILGTRGSRIVEQFVRNRNAQQWMVLPRTEHSRKPDEARRRIDYVFREDMTKLELFARGRAPPGWDVWGNEAIANTADQ